MSMEEDTTIEILKIQGQDNILYQLVAPLIMNPDVLRYNNGYPFKTSENFQWYIAVSKSQNVLGFIPLEMRNKKKCIINNYFATDDCHDNILSLLLHEIICDFQHARNSSILLTAIVQTQHQALFKTLGFKVIQHWKLYQKMQKEV
jgi:N-acetylglutamate synthase-like GNAT family acetyltransferase